MNLIKRSLGGIVMSLAELMVGILLLINPVGFTSGILMAVGVVLMLLGAGSIVRYFRTEPEEAAVRQSLVKGLVMLLGGGFCAFNTQWFIATFPVVTLVYGVVVLLTGLMKVQWTVDILRLKRKKWLLTALSALISILCGTLIIVNPFGTTAVLWMFTGISLMVEAVFDMAAMLFGNRANPAPTEQTPS